MIENRNVNIITSADGQKLVLINDIRFKAKVRGDWTAVENFPDEYTSSESRIALKGAVAKAKANAAQAVPELIWKQLIQNMRKTGKKSTKQMRYMDGTVTTSDLHCPYMMTKLAK